MPCALLSSSSWISCADQLVSVATGMDRILSSRGSDLPSMPRWTRSEEHTTELQSLMRTSYAVFCLKKTTETHTTPKTQQNGRTIVVTITHNGSVVIIRD